jgi:hypothetical protein
MTLLLSMAAVQDLGGNARRCLTRETGATEGAIARLYVADRLLIKSTT